MFDENFSFDTARSPSLRSTKASSTRDTSRSVSPCSPISPFSAPPGFSVTDLAASFATQRLHGRAQICYDSCEAYAANDDDAGWVIHSSIEEAEASPLARTRTYPPRPARPHSPSQRLQRQLNSRLLCSTSHHRDISALVAQMVESNEQCSISPPEAMSAPAAVDDEGYDSSDGSYSGSSLTPVQSHSHSRRSSLAASKQRLEYRRSSDITKAAGACVTKGARFRKDKKHSRKPSTADRLSS
ncbi:hypothetical protein M433DRAFT_144558 [Acidomyces richmondensis BFW]|nr:MAG: hypothetical protein FE78DRAFT_70291 [Acidomyces sp. 'richmondensis']KYG44789.1 hypothetical protein M433DRAFT_144558 [Acidomyces richmondensis BFW]